MTDPAKTLDLPGLFAAIQTQMEASQRLQREHSLHKGETGEASEALWVDLLREYLPKRYAIDSGIVVDSEGKASQQQDLIVFDRQYSPFVLHHGGLSYVPAESVYAVFEVKQDLNKTHLEYAANKARSVRSLKRTSAKVVNVGNVQAARPLFDIPAGLLTLSSSWSPPMEATFEKHFLDFAKDPDTRLNLGCTLEGGGYRLVDDNGILKVVKSRPEISLMYFLLSLFHVLQQLGTVPAIDVQAYLKWLE
jgi:hypothetical protein